MAHVVGSLAGLIVLIVGGVWLSRAHDAGRKPLAVALPLSGGVMGVLVVVLMTSAVDRTFGIDHSAILILLMLTGVLLGFAAGAALSRDYYKRGGDKDRSRD